MASLVHFPYTPWQSWSPTKPNSFHIPLRDYCPVKQTAPENQRPDNYQLKPPITGWCSWYAFGSHITEQRILDQARIIRQHELPIKYILIDDGWCEWGDWLIPNSTRFPQGIKETARKLHELGFKVGLWIAPYLVHSRSHIVQQHRDWLVRNSSNNLIDGFKITPFDQYLPWKKYALDTSQVVTQGFITQVIDTMIQDWHIDLLKLDFLYAPYFNPAFTTDIQPHQHLIELFTHIRTHYPDVYTIACGCPYKPARYMVDAIRVSKDITSPMLYTIPGLRDLIHTNRLRLLEQAVEYHQAHKTCFHLDPDPLIVSKKSGLRHVTHRLIQAHQKADAHFLGDDLKKLNAQDFNLIKRYLKLESVIPKS